MRFTIVTPSFRSSRWLKLCIASVADQGVALEHIIQDSCSDDGTRDWLPQDKRVTAVIEKDRGMYDAVNRGWRRGAGELLAYINCDEQYLPGALRRAGEFLESHPEVDVVFGDCVVVDAQGGYLCDRRALAPGRWHTITGGSLSFLTAATFLRRRLLEDRQLYFDVRYRDLGDADWALRLIQAGARMAVLGEFTSIFTETGHNMNLSANASREKLDFLNRAPAWMRLLAPAIVAHYRLRKLLAGAYRKRTYDYSIYTEDSPELRKTFHVANPTHRWVRPAAAAPAAAPVSSAG